MDVGDEFGFDPEILKRVWGEILPIAADDYDNAIERMPGITVPVTMLDYEHVHKNIDAAWRHAIDGGAGGTGATRMMRDMQQTLLATADAVKYAMDQYLAADSASAARLQAAHDNAAQTTGPHPVTGQP